MLYKNYDIDHHNMAGMGDKQQGKKSKTKQQTLIGKKSKEASKLHKKEGIPMKQALKQVWSK